MSEAQVVPPQNLDAERHLLGAAMVTDILGGVLAEVRLKPSDLYRERHREVFRAILALRERDAAIDALTVVDELERRGKLDAAGGKVEVQSLPDQVPAPGNALHYARIIAEHARDRRRLAAASEIAAAVHGHDEGRFVRAQEMLASAVIHSDALIDEAAQQEILWRLLEGEAKAEFFWPFDRLNQLSNGGMRRKHLVTLAGYTHLGKSHFADQLLDLNRKHGRVCLYKNEMSEEERVARRATRLARVSFDRLVQGKATDRERAEVLRHANELLEVGWPIVPVEGWTPVEVANHIREHRWDFVVVDILHNFLTDARNQVGEINAALSAFAACAAQANCVVVLVAHLSRRGIQESGQRRKPQLSDLRGSGDIENRSDCVCFLHREWDKDTNEPEPEGDVYFAKCRGGRLGSALVSFNEKRLRFEYGGSPRKREPEPMALAVGESE